MNLTIQTVLEAMGRPEHFLETIEDHSSAPNLAIDADGVSMRTLRALQAGEEFSLDYLAPSVPPAYVASAEGRFLASRPPEI